MGKANKLKSKVALTRRMEVEYLRPVPLGQPLVAEGRVSRMRGRALYNRAELRNARGSCAGPQPGKIPGHRRAEKMFAREFEPERRRHLDRLAADADLPVYLRRLARAVSVARPLQKLPQRLTAMADPGLLIWREFAQSSGQRRK